jgi:hypothetical protein
MQHVLFEQRSIDSEYWATVVAGVEPCLLPRLVNSVGAQRLFRSTSVKLDKSAEAIHYFCAQRNVTLTAFLQTVWTIVLRCYIGTDQPCFGYQESKSEILENLCHSLSRSIANSSVCRSDISATTSILQIMKRLQRDHERALQHQPCPLHKLQKYLELGAQSVFNTVVLVKAVGSQNLSGDLEISNRSRMSAKEESEGDYLHVSLEMLNFWGINRVLLI